MEAVRDNKVFFINTLSTDATFILNHVQQEKIITKRDYNNLNLPNHTQESIIIKLLDNVMNKGTETCLKFLQLLQDETVQETYPALSEHFSPKPRSYNKDNPAMASNEVNQNTEVSEYKMTSMPRGVCVIINNMKFVSHVKERKGSEQDKEALEKVFEWLGFQVRVFENQTAEQMKSLFTWLSQENHKGDCFVCCILSHGSAAGVLGTDGKNVASDDIFGPFSGTSCPTLVNKPKVFFIQACRGGKRQVPVVLYDDFGEAASEEEQEELEMDIEVITIPADADFLVARSTVKGYVSIRETVSGSWFIQSLCNQLRLHCPQGEDIQSILLHVNEEVSRKAAEFRNVTVKQMPMYKVTLRKKLVFRVPNQH